LTKALAIFGRKFRPWPSLRASREYHLIFPVFSSLLTRAIVRRGRETARKPPAYVMEEEKILMQELADKDEDARPDDGAIEINSDEEY
jgi:hypothetical protein